MAEVMTVNQAEYRVIRLLGRGKGGYSYLVEAGGSRYVLKQIHHEPCDYDTFGNKIEAEIHDYGRLQQTGIRMPRDSILRQLTHSSWPAARSNRSGFWLPQL